MCVDDERISVIEDNDDEENNRKEIGEDDQEDEENCGEENRLDIWILWTSVVQALLTVPRHRMMSRD